MDWYFGQKEWFKVKMSKWWSCFLQAHSFSIHNRLIDGLEWCGLLVYYCDVLSAVWTLILMAPIQYRGSIGEQVMSCISPNLFQWRNKRIYILDGLRSGYISSAFSFLGELFLYGTHFQCFHSKETVCFLNAVSQIQFVIVCPPA